MVSRFLPEGFTLDTPLCLLAGQGDVGSYPWELSSAALKAGAKLSLLSLKGETSQAVKDLFTKENTQEVAVGDLSGLLKALKSLQAKGLIMAGQVTPGKLFDGVFPDLRAVALIAGLKEKNAETIFGAISGEIQKEGVQVLDARAFMDDQLAEEGLMVKGKETLSPHAIEYGVKIAEAMAQLDVGQSVTVRKGTVLAVEAFEGTDMMIERSALFKADEKVFVKTVKKRQDWRFDVPVFGLKTLEGIIKAKIGSIILKKEGVLLPGKAEILKRAKAAGITIIGY